MPNIDTRTPAISIQFVRVQYNFRSVNRCPFLYRGPDIDELRSDAALSAEPSTLDAAAGKPGPVDCRFTPRICSTMSTMSPMVRPSAAGRCGAG